LLALLHHGVLFGDTLEHSALARLLDLPRHHNLIENIVSLVEVEDEIELANVAEVAVQAFHEVVDRFQSQQLVVANVDACNEEKTSVTLVADLAVPPLEKVADLWAAAKDQLAYLLDCLELVASMAFLVSTIRRHVKEKTTGISTTRSYWDGFVYLLMPAQQALAAYYFLSTAFEPSPSLVGQGRPFCLLTIGNLLQLMFYLTALAFYLADCLLGATGSMPQAADVAAVPEEEIISV